MLQKVSSNMLSTSEKKKMLRNRKAKQGNGSYIEEPNVFKTEKYNN